MKVGEELKQWSGFVCKYNKIHKQLPILMYSLSFTPSPTHAERSAWFPFVAWCYPELGSHTLHPHCVAATHPTPLITRGGEADKTCCGIKEPFTVRESLLTKRRWCSKAGIAPREMLIKGEAPTTAVICL